MTRQAAALPVDGDGDGRVFDGTKREMPAPRVRLAKKLGGALDQASKAGKSRKVRRRKLGTIDASARTPTVNKQTQLIAERADFKALPEATKRLAAAKIVGTDEFPAHMPGFGHFDPDDYEGVLAQVVSNLEAQYQVAARDPEYVDRAKQWYEAANRFAGSLGRRYGAHRDVAAAVLARLSPSAGWDDNVYNADSLFRFRSENPHVTPELRAALDEWDKGKHRLVDVPDGTPAWDIQDETTRAAYFRAWQILEIQALPDGEKPVPVLKVSPNGRMVVDRSTPPKGLSPQSLSIIADAMAIMDDPTRETVNERLGAGVKVRSFYNNIAYPNDTDDVTMDTHAMSSAFGAPNGTNEQPMKNIVASKSTGDGEYVKLLLIEAMRQVAANHPDVFDRPRQLQSLLWDQWRPHQSATKSTSKVRVEMKAALAAADDPSLTPEERRVALDHASDLMVKWLSQSVKKKVGVQR